MQISDELIDKLSNLAKLEFDDAEKAGIKSDLAQIIGFFEQINAIDTEGVEPLVYLNDENNAFRADEAKQLISHEAALSNAPAQDGTYILVPKMIKK